MRVLICSPIAAIGAIFFLSSPFFRVSADEPDKEPELSSGKPSAPTPQGKVHADKSVPEIDLLEARRQGLVSVQAEGAVTAA